MSFSRISQIHEAFSSGQQSCEQLVQNLLDRIQENNPSINAVVHTTEDIALNRAKEVDALVAAGHPMRPLEGIPFLAKDMFCVQGVPTTAASKSLAKYLPPYTATVVQRLLDAGAIFLGKCNQDEFGMGSSNEHSYFGPCRNPWSSQYVAGGSSGGSAAALAADFVPLALGTDTGGSIRQPAHFCGVTGLKPTYGRMSRYGVVAYASSLDQPGPMAQTVGDLISAYQVMAGNDPLDATSANLELSLFDFDESVDWSNIKVGWSPQLCENQNGVDPCVQEAIGRSREILKRLGAQVIEIDLPHFEYAIPTYYIIATCEASSNLARYDGVRFGHREGSETELDLEKFYIENRSAGFGEEVRRRILLGTYSLSSGYIDQYYTKACRVRRLIHRDFQSAFKKCDVILSPVTASSAFKLGEKTSCPIEMYLNDAFTITANLAGLPALSLPVLRSEKNLPVGVQLLANQFDEKALFQVALGLESQLGWRGLDE